MHDFLTFIKDVGVPTGIAFYLLHRIEGKLDTLTSAVVALSERLGPCPYSMTSRPPASQQTTGRP
jgi:hypothetical protein